MTPTPSDHRAIITLHTLYRPNGPYDAMTPTEIGELCYGDGHRTRSAYARPGGRLAARLVSLGYMAETVIRPGSRHEQRAFAWTGKEPRL